MQENNIRLHRCKRLPWIHCVLVVNEHYVECTMNQILIFPIAPLYCIVRQTLITAVFPSVTNFLHSITYWTALLVRH